MSNQNKDPGIRTLYILKMLYTGWSTKKASKQGLEVFLLWDCYIQGILRKKQDRFFSDRAPKVSWKNDFHMCKWVKTGIRTLYILEMLYAGCSTKKAMEHLKFQEKMTFTQALWVGDAKAEKTLESGHNVF